MKPEITELQDIAATPGNTTTQTLEETSALAQPEEAAASAQPEEAAAASAQPEAAAATQPAKNNNSLSSRGVLSKIRSTLSPNRGAIPKTRKENNNNSLSSRGVLSKIRSTLSPNRGATPKTRKESNSTNTQNETNSAPQSNDHIYTAKKFIAEEYHSRKYFRECKAHTSKDKVFLNMLRFIYHTNVLVRELIWQLDDRTRLKIQKQILEKTQKQILEKAEHDTHKNKTINKIIQKIKNVTIKDQTHQLQKKTIQLNKFILSAEQNTATFINNFTISQNKRMNLNTLKLSTESLINSFILLKEANRNINIFQQIFEEKCYKQNRTDIEESTDSFFVDSEYVLDEEQYNTYTQKLLDNHKQKKTKTADISDGLLNKKLFDLLRDNMQNYCKSLGLVTNDSSYCLSQLYLHLSESAQRDTSPTNRDINQTIEFLNLAKEVIASLHSRSSVIGNRDKQELNSQQLITPGYIIDDYISINPGATILDYHYYNQSTTTLYPRPPTPSAREIPLKGYTAIHRVIDAAIPSEPSYESLNVNQASDISNDGRQVQR